MKVKRKPWGWKAYTSALILTALIVVEYVYVFTHPGSRVH